MVSSSVSSSASSQSDLESTRKSLKRRFTDSDASDTDLESSVDSDEDLGAETSSSESESPSGSGSDSEEEEDTVPPSQNVRKRKNGTFADSIKAGINDGEGDEEEEEEEEEEIKVLSHKEQRRLRKKQQKTSAVVQANGASAQPSGQPTPSSKARGKEKDSDLNDSSKPKRQNSVWVGNLSFRTTPDALRSFFTDAGAGEVTRIHMPTKGVPGVEKMKMKGVQSVKENRGFAYVDFSTPEAKAVAISLSEKNLDGRRLLIKDGDDFSGRPAPSTSTLTPGTAGDPQSSSNKDADADADGANINPAPATGFQIGPNKTAKKILKAQKQPPCPCLFLGNLGFEATKERIKQMFEGHARALAMMRAKKRKEKEAKKGGKKRKRGEDDDLLSAEEGDHDGEEDDDGTNTGLEEKVEVDVGIKKVRMGTFEDSGVCKGFAFVDFSSTAHATAALTNPRNHFLDGRALVVEYASPEAARRGGYTGTHGGERKRKIPKRSGENKYNDWKKKQRHPGFKGTEEEDGDGDGKDETDNGVVERISKRPRTKEDAKVMMKTTGAKDMTKKKERRQKPGAALAQAQREKYAIVPSQGTRLKFS